MARVPTRVELADLQTSFKDVNEELRELNVALKKAKEGIPNPSEITRLQTEIQRLSKTPTYLDPNDVFRASGGAHMHGYVPDPGETPGTTKYLREDGTWEVPPGGGPGGTTDHRDLTNRDAADQHPASSITNTPADRIAATNVQTALNELDDEKLARDGTQTMLGHLQMNKNDIHEAHNIDMEDLSGQAKITMVRELNFKATATGEANIENVRVAHFVGDHTDDEAKIDGLERVVFNDEPTASSVEKPSRVDWNTGVTAGVDYTAAEGRMSFDDLEGTVVAYVASGASIVLVAMGWAVKLATNGFSVG